MKKTHQGPPWLLFAVMFSALLLVALALASLSQAAPPGTAGDAASTAAPPAPTTTADASGKK